MKILETRSKTISGISKGQLEIWLVIGWKFIEISMEFHGVGRKFIEICEILGKGGRPKKEYPPWGGGRSLQYFFAMSHWDFTSYLDTLLILFINLYIKTSWRLQYGSQKLVNLIKECSCLFLARFHPYFLLFLLIINIKLGNSRCKCSFNFI